MYAEDINQLNPSKCPLRMRSPMGDGARGGLGVPGAIVFARLALRVGVDCAPAGLEDKPGGVVLRCPCAVPLFTCFGAGIWG